MASRVAQRGAPDAGAGAWCAAWPVRRVRVACGGLEAPKPAARRMPVRADPRGRKCSPARALRRVAVPGPAHYTGSPPRDGLIVGGSPPANPEAGFGRWAARATRRPSSSIGRPAYSPVCLAAARPGRRMERWLGVFVRARSDQGSLAWPAITDRRVWLGTGHYLATCAGSPLSQQS